MFRPVQRMQAAPNRHQKVNDWSCGFQQWRSRQLGCYCPSNSYRPGVPKLGYICLSEGVYFRLATEGKKMSTYYSFRNTYTCISEYYFQNHYMLTVKFVFVIFLSLFVIRNVKGTCPSRKMLKGYTARESLGTPGIDSEEQWRGTPLSVSNTHGEGLWFSSPNTDTNF